MLVDADTGVTLAPIAGFWENKEVDSAQFIKLFVNGVKAFAELTSAGTKVFELLYLEVQRNIGKDQVYISYAALDENTNTMAQSTFRRGMAELIAKKFIAPMTAPSWYWINPDFIWNGDRLAFVKEYHRKDNDQQVIQQKTKAMAESKAKK